jgi:hypothetical protein
VALWSLLLNRRQAVAAGVVFAVTPGAWLLAGRAFTGSAATALAAAALVAWLWPRQRPACRLSGSALAAASLLIRPHLLPLLAPALLWRLWRDRRCLAAAAQSVGPLAACLALGAAVIVADTGGFGAYWLAVREHAGYHFPALTGFTWRWSELAVVAALGAAPLAAAWWFSAGVGWALWLADRTTRSLAAVLLVGFAAQLMVLLCLQNPTHPRYAVPLLALSAGPVIAAWSRLRSIGLWGLVASLIIVWMVQVLPALGSYRSDVAPPLQALRAGEAEACDRGGVLVIDRTLVAFEELLELRGELEASTLHDIDLDSGRFAVPPARETVVVWDLRRGPPPVDGGHWELLTVQEPVLRRLAQDRFLDVAVIAGGTYIPR